jgi:phenylacetate-coenzyme A ligase PaaK-like adenylate-forming protein
MKLSPLEGRTGQSIKVRQLFVYPRHAGDIQSRVPGIAELRLLVRRRNGSDELDLSVRLEPGVRLDAVESALREAVTDVTRLRAGTIDVREGEVVADEQVLEDERDLG